MPALLAPYGDAGTTIGDLPRLDDLPTIEATGRTGDVYLCHPFLVHAAQAHRGTQPKFMAQPGLHPAEGALDLYEPASSTAPVIRATRSASTAQPCPGPTRGTPVRDGREGIVLLSVTGVSGAGKSASLAALSQALAHEPVSCVEFDSVGVPADADTAWRHGVVEHWVQHALAEQEHGRHLILCGQVAMGELLAARRSRADQLDGIAACVLDCSRPTSAARASSPAAMVQSASTTT